MSVWSGIAAAGVAIALAFVAVGQPLWQWQMDDTQGRESWTYNPFSAHQVFLNKSTNVTTSRSYSVDGLTAIQEHMAAALAEFDTFFALGLVAGFAGTVLSVMSAWKKLRGIFAGLAFVGACAAMLYVGFAMVFSLPSAATQDLPRLGSASTQFAAEGSYGAQLLSTSPGAGWILVLGAGLAFAWASSDIWHIVPAKKGAPKKMEATVKRVPPKVVAPPPPPAELLASAPEPNIEEVFVIGSNGLLVKHMSRSLMSDKDRDVVGSMISAISSFVREAFTERDGEVHEVTLGDHRFVMCSDSGIVLAVLVSSGDTEDIVHRLRHLLAILGDRYGDRLATWQGEPLEGIEDELQVLWEPYHLPPPPAA
jgi:predicted regulator of Ras-like GTPase activity (Roadblock/LC7/MglB family)